MWILTGTALVAATAKELTGVFDQTAPRQRIVAKLLELEGLLAETGWL